MQLYDEQENKLQSPFNFKTEKKFCSCEISDSSYLSRTRGRQRL